MLLVLARQAVTSRISGGRNPAPAPSAAGSPSGRGAFVTLRRDGVLRGCVGHVDAVGPLSETVRRVAVAAATEDPRFAPVEVDELPGLVFEVSVLGPLVRCAGPAEVEVGRHGIVVEDTGARALLLPQVAVEQRWDADAFVAAACAKAGLARPVWPGSSRLFVFDAEVFSEDDAEPPSSRCP